MWIQIFSAAVGIWLMASPQVLGYGAPASTSDWIVGPIIASFAIVAIWESTRAVRTWNLPFAAWLLVAPWILDFPIDATINSGAAGLATIITSLIRGRMRHRFADGWAGLWRKPASE